MKKENKVLFPRKFLIIANIFLLFIVIVLIIIILREGDNNKIKNSITRDASDSFNLTNPILDCENNFSGQESVVSPREINEKVLKLKNEYSLEHISLYFRDLNNGPWVGINEKEEFSPASLLKVPIMIAFLREAQDDESLLTKKITIKNEDLNKILTPNIIFDNLLEVGKEYNLVEIAESMIQNSDNTGVIVLLKNVKSNYLKEVFGSVGVPFKDTITEVPVRVKDYAGFFRVLYNSSYLNRSMSEKALDILSKSRYMNGLRKGVPSEIIIAHKFGERTNNEGTDTTQLHDCGIIYYPKRPYLLCIMTRGDNLKNQEKVIGELSRFVYTEVDKIKEKN